MPPETLAQLVALEEFLRPRDLVDRVRGVVLGSRGGDLDDIEDTESTDYGGVFERMNATAENLGNDVANDEAAFETLLPELMRGGSRVALRRRDCYRRIPKGDTKADPGAGGRTVG
jgi:hypothetical protein